MYCRECGSEISNEAKFCNFCGTEAVKPKAQTNESVDFSEGQKPNEAQNSAIADETSDALSAAAENESAQTTDATQAQPTTQTAAAQPETSSLKAAVAQNKKRSRRRMPMILLVALALALATSVAYAAYRAYTDAWVPYQAEQQQKAQAEKDAQDAQNAYDEIIKEYSDALNQVLSGSAGHDEIMDKYPHVNSEPFPYYSEYSNESTANNYRYTTKDLNDDGIPELLIGKDVSEYGSTYTSVAVYDIWSYQNGNLTHILSGITRGDFSLRNNNVIMSRVDGGAYINGFTMTFLKKGQLIDGGSNDSRYFYDESDNWENIEGIFEDRIDGITMASSDNPLVEYTKYDGNGNSTDSGTCTAEQFSSMLKDLFNKYPEDTSVEWKTIPTN